MRMKRNHRQRTLLPFRKGGRGVLCLLLGLLFTACGGDGNSFSVEGKFKNFNQGEFYVYGLEESPIDIDTIRVDRGNFAYEYFDNKPATIVLVFPNFSELPVFTEPGEGLDIKADATNLSELQVSGTKDNELMTLFRKKILGESPADVPKIAEEFVREHLDSRICEYIVLRHFMQGQFADNKKAEQLLSALSGQQPENMSIKRLQLKAKNQKNTEKGTPMPTFSGTGINQGNVSSSVLKNTPVSVVTTCASWNYESMDVLRRLCRLQRRSRGQLSIVSILIDGNKQECERTMKRDSITCPVIFDPDFFDGKAIKTLGMTTVCDNVVYRNGLVYGSHYSGNDLYKEVEKLLKK